MSESRVKDDWRWVAILLGRVVGYCLVGMLLFAYIGGMALLYLGGPNLNGTAIYDVAIGVLFGYAALRSSPRQGNDPDSQMLFNLVLWPSITTAFGYVLLALTLNFVDELLKLPEFGGSWMNTFVSIKPGLVLLCMIGFNLVGVHLALVRVENKRKEAREADLRSQINNLSN